MPPKKRFIQYFVYSSRFLLAFKLIHYGVGKLTGDQFGVSQATMDSPLKTIDLFRLSWYLADHEPFKSFIGISQIITGALIAFRKTVLLGAFMSIPIWLNILVWDMTFMGTWTPFTFIITFYLLLTFFILWRNRSIVIESIKKLLTFSSDVYKPPIWAYLILPIGALFLDGIIALSTALLRWLFSA